MLDVQKNQNRVLDPLELELQMVINFQVSAGNWTQAIFKVN